MEKIQKPCNSDVKLVSPGTRQQTDAREMLKGHFIYYVCRFEIQTQLRNREGSIAPASSTHVICRDLIGCRDRQFTNPCRLIIFIRIFILFELFNLISIINWILSQSDSFYWWQILFKLGPLTRIVSEQSKPFPLSDHSQITSMDAAMHYF